LTALSPFGDGFAALFANRLIIEELRRRRDDGRRRRRRLTALSPCGDAFAALMRCSFERRLRDDRFTLLSPLEACAALSARTRLRRRDVFFVDFFIRAIYLKKKKWQHKLREDRNQYDSNNHNNSNSHNYNNNNNN